MSILEKVRFWHVSAAIAELGLIPAGFLVTPYAFLALIVIAIFVMVIETTR
jgi:hypothetical protein